MLKYILKRLAILVATLFIVITITFFLMQIMPGTPFNNPRLSPEMLASLEKAYGLDKPLWQQYLSYLFNAFHGDFGLSFQYDGQQVSTLIGQRLAVSVQLGIGAVIIGIVLGFVIGAISARHKNDWIDGLLSVVSTSRNFSAILHSCTFCLVFIWI